jgi:16S rRNA (guanine527-N7)-methyltransferase
MSDPRLDRLAVAATQLEVELDTATAERLLGFLDLLQRWNATYNLTSVRDPDEMLTQHLVDCLAVIPALERVGPRRILDVGSGGGLPGVVIAAIRPDSQVVCVDTVGKKAAFVRQAAVELGLRNLQGEHARVEKLRAAPFDLITSRAFASLPDFVSLTRQHLEAAGVWMAMKGKRPDVEIAGLPADIEMFHVEHLTVPGVEADRCLVWMRPRP